VQNFLFKWTFFDILDTPPKKNFSAHMRKSCTFDLKKCLNYKKRNHKIFKKKRFPKKIISIIHNLLYLPFKKNFVDKNLCEWVTSTKKKSTQNPLPTPCLFSKFYLCLAFWFNSQYSFFFCLFWMFYIYTTITNF